MVHGTHNSRGERKPHDLYRFYDTDGALLYVGISFHAIQRASQHRAEKPWWPDVARMDVEHHPSRADALAAELAAIQNEHPVYNVSGAVPGAPATVRQAVDSPDGMVGHFVLTGHGDHQHSSHQGVVTARCSDNHYLVQWMSWWDGCWTNAAVVPIDEMVGWKFYSDHDEFLEGGRRHWEETKRRRAELTS